MIDMDWINIQIILLQLSVLGIALMLWVIMDDLNTIWDWIRDTRGYCRAVYERLEREEEGEEEEEEEGGGDG